MRFCWLAWPCRRQAWAAELQAKASEVLLRAEGEALARLFAPQADATEEQAKAYESLAKLYNKGLRHLAGTELPGPPEGTTAVSVTVAELAALLNGEVALNEGTDAVDLAFDGGTLTLSTEEGVLLNGTKVTAEMLAALPAELSAEAGFLTDLLQATVAGGGEEALVITLPAPAETPVETGN